MGNRANVHLLRRPAFFLFCSSLAGLVAASSLQKRPVRYSDLTPQLRDFLKSRGVTDPSFSDFVHSIEQGTAEREREGENDHLVYFILQSRRFTQQPKIEPALSAYEFVQNLRPEERGKYLSAHPPCLPALQNMPAPVARRIDDFIDALGRLTTDERLSYFKGFLERSKSPSVPVAQYLYSQYARSMRFLYEKEFRAKEVSASEKGPFLASLYQERGHSTDTRLEANFAVRTALSVLKQLNPSLELDHVLIVGPGLDLAPRTDLIDAVPPQSYQPFAVADALLGLGLSLPDRLRVDCVDINDRVVQFIQEFPKRKTRSLTVFWRIDSAGGNSIAADYKSYFDNFGKSIGKEAPVERPSAPLDSYLAKSVLVRRDLAEKITADRMNIITERYHPSPKYDLVVVTNVFLYFSTTELALSVGNIQSMMRTGGYLVHNEFRPELEALSRTLGLEPIQARTLRLAGASQGALLDGFVVHKKH